MALRGGPNSLLEMTLRPLGRKAVIDNRALLFLSQMR